MRTFLTVVTVAILVLAAYLTIEVSSLQGQVSSLQGQNSILQGQVGDLQNQQYNLQSQLSHLLSTSTGIGVPSFEITSVCLSVAPQCQLPAGYPGSYVYVIALDDNGTTTFPQSVSIFLDIKDTTRSTDFGFNASLPQELVPGGTMYLNATSWPQYTNATSKLAGGNQVALAVLLGNLEATVLTRVITCTVTTTTFLNYTTTQTATNTECS
jgi:hypothetical protein